MFIERIMIAWDGNLVSLVSCRIRCYIVINNLSVLPTKYSVLGYSLLENLMHYKKHCVIYELTAR